MMPFLGCNLSSSEPAMMGVVEGGGAAASAGRGSTILLKRRGIKVSRGGLDAALPWVQFNVVQALDDGGSDPNHAMLI
jgi:hypothetical protein